MEKKAVTMEPKIVATQTGRVKFLLKKRSEKLSILRRRRPGPYLGEIKVLEKENDAFGVCGVSWRQGWTLWKKKGLQREE